MNSCLYECHVLHARFSPRPHCLLHRIFFFALDLDELDALHRRLPLFSVNRANLYSFRERDFLPTGEPIHCPAPIDKCHIMGDTSASLKQRVIAYLAQRGVDLTGGRVLLVTLPRVFGYLFNPVSFYFCHDRTGAPGAVLRLWHGNFRARLDQVRALGFDARFIRKWTYYLGYCEAAFAMRNLSVIQTLHTRANNLSLK